MCENQLGQYGVKVHGQKVQEPDKKGCYCQADHQVHLLQVPLPDIPPSAVKGAVPEHDTISSHT
jgi:hypothetical protein